jgi:hypothetical protein
VNVSSGFDILPNSQFGSQLGLAKSTQAQPPS